MLTIDEIEALWIDPGKGRSTWFARAIIAATIDKLAAGVSVEPVAYFVDCGEPIGYAEVDEAHRGDSDVVPLYTSTAIAAARVQALKEAANLVKGIEARCIAKDVDDPPLEHVIDAIHSLIGKEST